MIIAQPVEDMSDDALEALWGAVARERRRRRSDNNARNVAIVEAIKRGGTFDSVAATFNVSRGTVAGAAFRAGGVASLRALIA